MSGKRPELLLVYPLLDASVEDDLRRDEAVRVVDAEGEDADALRRGLATAAAVILHGPARLTRELIGGAPALRVIGAIGSGVDNIDVSAASERSIPVVSGTGAAPEAIAEYCVGAMVASHRGFLSLHQELVEGRLDWPERLTRPASVELTGSTLGVVGFGAIGRLVAAKARAAFGVEVLVHSRRALELPPGMRRADGLDDLLARSHTVSLHVPRTPDTRGLIGERELGLMRREAVLVDTTRGGVVDADALVAALHAGRLRGAVVDVFSVEPPPPDLVATLASAPGLVLTPHVAGVTVRARRLLTENVVTGVMTALAGGRPERVANPEIYG